MNDRAKPNPRLRQALIVAVCVLAVLLFLYLLLRDRPGSANDYLDDSTPYTFDSSANRTFRTVDSRLAVVSSSGLQLLDDSGKTVLHEIFTLAQPGISVGGERVCAYDIGGTALYVLDETGPRLELTSDGPLVSANLNGSGMLAVTTQISGTKGHVDVYGADMQVLFAFNAHRRFVADACVTEDGGYLAAVTMGQADSVFISDLVIYDLTQEDPVADYSVPDGLVTAMTGRGDRILTVTDTCLAVGNTAGKLVGTYSYNGEYLREYDLGGEDYTVLQLNRYQSGSVGRLVTVDDDGEEIASLDVAEEVRDVSACGRYLSVLYADRLVVYNRQLQAYATLHGPEHTREVLTRADGSVLMIGADSAELFLP